jgi:hypothetical protein
MALLSNAISQSLVPEEDPFSEVFEYEGYRYPAYLPKGSSRWIELLPNQELPYSITLPNGRSTTIIPTKEYWIAIIDAIPSSPSHHCEVDLLDDKEAQSFQVYAGYLVNEQVSLYSNAQLCASSLFPKLNKRVSLERFIPPLYRVEDSPYVYHIPPWSFIKTGQYLQHVQVIPSSQRQLPVSSPRNYNFLDSIYQPLPQLVEN